MPFGLGPPGARYARSPYATLARLGETTPRHYVAERDAWFISARADIAALLRDDRLIITPGSSFSDQSDAFRTTVARRLRAWFASSDAMLAETVATVTENCVATLAKRGEGDLAQAVARTIPSGVMAALLGIPPADLSPLQHIADDILQSYDLDGRERSRSALSAPAMLRLYFQNHWRTARSTPLLALLRDAQAESALPQESMVDACSKLFTAGTTSTSGCIANILARWVGAANAAYISPDPEAVEELLRRDTPILAVKRIVREAVQWDDTTLAPGQKVYLMTATANRSPTPNGERSPPSLTFGLGRYHCLGAMLARIEIAEMLDRLRPLAPHFRLARPIEWREAWLVHEARSIPVTIHGALNAD